MSVWSLTKSELTDRIKVLLRRLSGNPTITWLEGKVISDSINEAVMDLSMETGIGRWRVQNRNVTATTTASTQYADLSGSVLKIVQDSVQIKSENTILLPATMEFILQYNGDGSTTGTPIYYSADVNPSDTSVTRMQFSPIPDGTYTVDLMVTLFPDEDDIDDFPGWFFPALMDKSFENALRNLGYLNESQAFEESYRIRKRKLRDMDLPDGPIVIARPNRTRYRGLESRIP